MNDKMTPDKERENCTCRKAIINPFDAMMMVVVRRLDGAYHELYENDDLAGGAWTVWNDIGCPVDKILIIIAKLSINEPIQKAVADLLM